MFLLSLPLRRPSRVFPCDRVRRPYDPVAFPGSPAAAMSTPARPIDEALLHAVEEIAERAGEVILGYYSRDIAVARKADASPVTEADDAAERAILPALAALAPEIPAISE